jgi:hypothetical protein
VWWNEKIGSQITASFNISSYKSFNTVVNSSTTISLIPVNWCVAQSGLGRINASLGFKSVMRYDEDGAYKYLRVHDYGVFLTAPELEINIPYLENLRAIAKLGGSIDWSYDNYGKISTINGAFTGVSFANLGIFYFFTAGEKAEEAPQGTEKKENKEEEGKEKDGAK